MFFLKLKFFLYRIAFDVTSMKLINDKTMPYQKQSQWECHQMKLSPSGKAVAEEKQEGEEETK